jgi:hypothetical protein
MYMLNYVTQRNDIEGFTLSCQNLQATLADIQPSFECIGRAEITQGRIDKVPNRGPAATRVDEATSRPPAEQALIAAAR